MASHEQVKEQLFRIIREQQILEQDPESILNLDLLETAAVDSLSLAQFVTVIEEQFKVKIDEQVMIEELHSLRDIIDYLQKLSA